MTAGLALSVAFGHWAHVDFSLVDEHDVTTTAPVALLGSGLLAAFPVSGYLIAKASNLPTLLEPALASGLAILLMLVLLGAGRARSRWSSPWPSRRSPGAWPARGPGWAVQLA